MQCRLTDYGNRRERKSSTNCGPSLSLSTVKERQLKSFLSELLNNKNDNKHHRSSYLYNSFQLCAPNCRFYLPIRTQYDTGQTRASAAHQHTTQIQQLFQVRKLDSVTSGQFLCPGREGDRQTNKHTDRQLCIEYLRQFCAASSCHSHKGASVDLKLTGASVSVCTLVLRTGARYLLCVA